LNFELAAEDDGFSMAREADGITAKFDWRSKVFDSLSLPALILTPNRVVLDANQSFLKEYGVKKDEVIGRACHEIFYQSKESCPYDTCPLSKVLAEKTGQAILRRVKVSGRKEKWEDRIFSPILDDTGRVRYVIEKIRDVTHVKRLERELSGIKVFMEKFVQSSISSIIAANLRGKILIMNPAAEELTGYTFQEARNKNHGSRPLSAGTGDRSHEKTQKRGLRRQREVDLQPNHAGKRAGGRDAGGADRSDHL
jgi:PAS domain S-box-containing protein